MLKELLIKNRSFRRFDESFEIKNDELVEIIEAARFCHSARNQQGLMFKLITDKENSDKIFPLLKWAAYLQDWNGPKQGERPTAYIVIGINKNRASLQDKWIMTDLGIATEAISMLLAEKGLGACIIAAFMKNELKEILNIPEHIESQSVLAIGKPVEHVETVDILDDDDIRYYRIGNIHYVPKRVIDELLF